MRTLTYVLIGGLTVAALVGWFRAVRVLYYFRGRIDEVEAISAACSPEELSVDPDLYRARVLHQVRNAVGLSAAQRYIGRS
jgi:hypothetical protein